jgi:hypothetical protein
MVLFVFCYTQLKGNTFNISFYYKIYHSRVSVLPIWLVFQTKNMLHESVNNFKSDDSVSSNDSESIILVFAKIILSLVTVFWTMRNKIN